MDRRQDAVDELQNELKNRTVVRPIFREVNGHCGYIIKPWNNNSKAMCETDRPITLSRLKRKTRRRVSVGYTVCSMTVKEESSVTHKSRTLVEYDCVSRKFFSQ